MLCGVTTNAAKGDAPERYGLMLGAMRAVPATGAKDPIEAICLRRRD